MVPEESWLIAHQRFDERERPCQLLDRFFRVAGIVFQGAMVVQYTSQRRAKGDNRGIGSDHLLCEHSSTFVHLARFISTARLVQSPSERAAAFDQSSGHVEIRWLIAKDGL